MIGNLRKMENLWISDHKAQCLRKKRYYFCNIIFVIKLSSHLISIYLNKVSKDRCISFSTNHFDNFWGKHMNLPKGRIIVCQKVTKKKQQKLLKLRNNLFVERKIEISTHIHTHIHSLKPLKLNEAITRTLIF